MASLTSADESPSPAVPARADAGVIDADESLHLTRFAIERALDAVFLIAADGRFFQVNETACRMLGYTREQLTALGVPDVDPDFRADEWDRTWQRFRASRCERFESTNVRRDGRVIPVEISMNFVRHGDKEYVCNFVRDVSERRTTERSLRESEERFRNLIEGSIQGISVVDEDWRFLFVNQSYATMFGYDNPDEILALGNIEPVLAAHEIPRMRGYSRARLAGGSAPSQYEFDGVRQDGAPITVLNMVRRISWMGRPAMQATVIDITDRKRAERALVHENERRRLAEQVSGVGFWEIMPGNETCAWSEHVYEIHGWEPGRPVDVEQALSAYHPEDRAAVEACVRGAIERGEPFEFERRLVRAGGEVRLVHVRASVREAMPGGATSVFGVIQDVTDLRRVESADRERRAAHARLVTALEASSEGVALFDGDDRLVFFNDQYRRSVRAVADALEPGLPFESLVRESVRRGAVADADGREEDWIRWRLERHRNPEEPFEIYRRDSDQWLQLREQRLADGGTFIVVGDISAQKRSERALQESQARLLEAQRRAHVGSWEWSHAEQRIVHWSEELSRIFGIDHAVRPVSREEFLGFVHGEDRESLERDDRVLGVGDGDHEYRIVRPDGEVRHVASVGEAVRDAAGQVRAHTGTIMDITGRKRAEIELRASEERYSLAIRGSTDGIWDYDLDRNTVYLSPRLQEILGLRRRVPYVEAADVLALIHPEDREAYAVALAAHLRGDTDVFEFEMRATGDDGVERWVLDRGLALRDRAGRAHRMAGSVVDITDRKHAEQALADKTAHLEAAFESMEQGISMVNGDLTMVACNRRFLDLLDFPPDRFGPGTPFEEFIRYNAERGEYGEGDVDRLVKERVERARQFEPHRFQHERPDGSVLEIRGRPMPGGGFVTTYTDVTEAHNLSRRLSYQATHDGLTGLVNRTEFDARLKRVLRSLHAEPGEHALCYLDLDQFKVINDTCGHMAGDELLRKLGRLLPERVRKHDTLARLGGDEFGVLMEHCELEQAERVADSLRSTIEGFRFLWEDKSFKVGVSVGLVPISIESVDAASVLSAADTACYAAKEQGGNRVHVYRPGDEEVGRRHGEMRWVARINRALEEDRFELCYQPIVRSDGGRDDGTHYELLLRMVSEDGTTVAPGSFLPAAERYNLAPRLDRWVIATAFDWLAAHPRHLERLFVCSINLSGHSLGDETFRDFVLERFAGSCVRTEQICFEITETAAISNLAGATRFIRTLKRKGCRFALDDFGSGLSSFAYLKTLPVDYLKIDGVFVKDVERDPIDLALVRSINEIGQVMGKQTIAEFVENDAVLAHVREAGVDYVQGYGIGAPRPLARLLER